MIRLNYLSLSDLEWNIEKWSMQQRIAAARLGDIRVCGTPQSRHTAGQLSSCLTSPHTMEALIVQPHEGERGMHEEEEYEKNGELDEGEIEPSSPVASRSEDDTDEDSEPEPPPVIRRKVSFADAFGLDLVSVKEFDNAESPHPQKSWIRSCASRWWSWKALSFSREPQLSGASSVWSTSATTRASMLG
ncbi:PREDICTED: uncharacterized protein LOC107095317 isoform X6 [Cyprinodon variegatus]|uniref:uncharacterized protein LOC107095317 isoform X6 n=1 Tax=Cyprinodon variegatus TaxID=28743 RepID=UPI00074267B7|nr:PREDICTED: uncharacterized protein LOC107095317 isoform X6 [Cyprinodon variegatus]